MKSAIFIDYDNLGIHKTSGILDIVTKVLIQTPIDLPFARGTCDVRVYGGWYEGNIMSQLAQKVAVSIQRQFPAIIRVPRDGGTIPLLVNAELAVSLLEEPAHHLFNTYRKKGRPNNIRVYSPGEVGCIDASCLLPFTRKLLKTGKCPISTCDCKSDDLIYRHEQKIVDTMLTCDLLYATRLDLDYVILISSDDDFLPPVRTCLLRGTPIVRFHPTANAQRATSPGIGARFFEMEL